MYFLYPANEAVRRENNNLTNEVYLLIPVSEGDEIKKVRKRLEVETDALQAAFEEIEAVDEEIDWRIQEKDEEFENTLENNLRSLQLSFEVDEEIDWRIQEKDEEFENTLENNLRSLDSVKSYREVEDKDKAETLRMKKKLVVEPK
ncbi:hypothetical protein QE152_g9569 [Popillia japonica]|uniref:Uncharacterized protein n=1 Tax=Popillia japonica TaxID=7064 RepID=A0AAW1LUI6_POPJA